MPTALSWNLRGGNWGCKGPPYRSSGFGFVPLSCKRLPRSVPGNTLCSRDGAALGTLGPPTPCPDPGHSLQEEGPGHGLAPDVGPVEQRVEVGQQRVAKGEGRPHGSLRRVPEPVRLLRLRREAGAEEAPGPGEARPAGSVGREGSWAGPPAAPPTRLCRLLWFRMKG